MINEVDNNGAILNNQTEIGECFNQYFAEIGPKLAKDIREVDVSYKDYLNKNGEYTNRSQVLSLLSKLCKSKATGLDNISAKLLRECPDFISDLLTVIFNKPIEIGMFPVE